MMLVTFTKKEVDALERQYRIMKEVQTFLNLPSTTDSERNILRTSVDKSLVQVQEILI